MKKLKQLVMGAGSFILTASTAFAKVDLLDTSNLSPAIQPFANLVADNIVSLYFMAIGAGILIFAGLSLYERNRGHSQQASNHKNSSIDCFWTGVISLVLYYAFSVLAGTFGPK
jgi:uncharacterized membrane protein